MHFEYMSIFYDALHFHAVHFAIVSDADMMRVERKTTAEQKTNKPKKIME